MYHCGFELDDLYNRLQTTTDPYFDLVIFSGVLYHMLDPMTGLLRARRLVRNGGIIIIETSMVLDDNEVLFFNAGGRHGEGDNFWCPSLACLDYLLRYVRLKPLDCFYHLHSPNSGRVCVPCLAMPSSPDADKWMISPQHKDEAPYIDWEELERVARPPLAYDRNNDVVFRREGSVNLLDTIRQIPESLVTDPQTQVRLPLEGIY